MHLPFERKLPFILLVVFLMMAVTGFVFYQSTVSLQETIGWERHAQEVLRNIDETQSVVLDMESGVRGFVLTGNDTYLEPFNNGKSLLGERLSKIRSMTQETAKQQEELALLDGLVQQFNAGLSQKVTVRKENNFEAAYGLLNEAAGREITRQIRASLGRLRSAELALQQERENRLTSNLRRTIWIFIIGSALGVLALAAANLLMLRESKRRREAQDALRDANRDLEEKVEARTAELKGANERLSAAGLERENLLVREQAARREAEIANRLRDEFLATVSHELRTPLNAIVGWARLMKAGKLDEKRTQDAIDTILKNSDAQTRLIKDLMDVARVISGKLKLDLGTVAVDELVWLAADSIRPEAEEKGLALGVDVSGLSAGEIVNGDRTRLLQVFSNLLANAVKFTPRGGRIDVTARTENDRVRIDVRDDGVGISPEFLPLVFERFRQDTESARRSGGLGLGLAIVRNLVEQHGGTVSVESEGENRGSVFTVQLPLAAASSRGASYSAGGVQ